MCAWHCIARPRPRRSVAFPPLPPRPDALSFSEHSLAEDGSGANGDRRDGGADKTSQLAFEISGWRGYNARFNGQYTLTGETRDSRPVFKHMHENGVGAGHDWCRMYWANGFWKIGHMHWVHSQPELCCARIKSDAMHPTGIPAHEKW